MLEGNTGTAKATISNIRSIGSVQAEAWRGKTERTDRREKTHSAEILRLDDFRPVPPPLPARRRDTRELEKLHSSITGVTESLATQSAACRDFKDQIAELRMEIESLGRNMDLYRAKLAGIDTSPIRRKALRLAAMMDPWTRR